MALTPDMNRSLLCWALQSNALCFACCAYAIRPIGVGLPEKNSGKRAIVGKALPAHGQLCVCHDLHQKAVRRHILKPPIFSNWIPGASLLLAVLLLGLFVWGGNQPQAAGLVPAPWDKLAHLTWFATLAGLLVLGLRGSGRRIPLLVALACMALGSWDEWRQLALPGRSFGLDDLLADGVGIALGIFLATWVWRVRLRN